MLEDEVTKVGPSTNFPWRCALGTSVILKTYFVPTAKLKPDSSIHSRSPSTHAALVFWRIFSRLRNSIYVYPSRVHRHVPFVVWLVRFFTSTKLCSNELLPHCPLSLPAAVHFFTGFFAFSFVNKCVSTLCFCVAGSRRRPPARKALRAVATLDTCTDSMRRSLRDNAGPGPFPVVGPVEPCVRDSSASRDRIMIQRLLKTPGIPRDSVVHHLFFHSVLFVN